MKREDLEHVIRAAGAVAATDRLVILGSQAILGSDPHPPSALTASLEVDVYPLDDPGKADLIDGSIGELSPFHDAFGYFAHGVGPETARLPKRWKDRLVTIQNENTHAVAGLCLHPTDLAIGKLIAGRPKDLDYVWTMLNYRIVSEEDLRILLPELDQPDADTAEANLTACLRREGQ